MKKIYNWILSWANSPYGSVAIFIHAFIESVFFPIPPDVLLIALCVGKPKKAFKFATICLVGSILGAITGYAIGHYIWINSVGDFTSFAQFFFDHIPGFTVELYDKIKELYNQYNFWIVFTAGFTPIPYKVFTITSGVFGINFFMFLIASIISRGARFFLLSALIWKYGPRIKTFIDKQFNLLAIAFTLLLVLGFIAIKYLV